MGKAAFLIKLVMLLQIDDNKYISDLQEKFNECFPYLQIEFYKTKYKEKQFPEVDIPVNPKTLVGSIIKKQKSRLVEIKSWYKTSEVEHIFKKDFGLSVKVFRLQGKHWIQTSNKDELTLQQQNDIAKSSIHKDGPLSMMDEELEV